MEEKDDGVLPKLRDEAPRRRVLLRKLRRARASGPERFCAAEPDQTTYPQQSKSANTPQRQDPNRSAIQSSYAPPNSPAPRAANWTGTSAPIRYNTTGLWIWSVCCLLMLLIPGVIAISNTAQINKCDTVEQQEKHIKTARIACIIGTVLGVLIIIGRLAQGA